MIKECDICHGPIKRYWGRHGGSSWVFVGNTKLKVCKSCRANCVRCGWKSAKVVCSDE